MRTPNMDDDGIVNIFTYRGSSYMLDFEKYLSEKGVRVEEIELINGMIGVITERSEKPVMFMQTTTWHDIAEVLA